MILLVAFFAVLPVRAGTTPTPPIPFNAHVTATAGPPPSGAPPWFMEVHGSGVATLMGHITVYQYHYVVPTADPNVVAFYGGYWLWTAANGDQLYGTYAGTMPFNPAGYFEIHGHFWITGGTGRFAGATGEGPASGSQSMQGIADLYLNGWISIIP